MYCRRFAHTAFLATAAAMSAAAPLHAQSAPMQSMDAPVEARSAPVLARSASVTVQSALQPVPRSALTAYAYLSAADVPVRWSDERAALQDRGGWSALRVAKWTTAALSAGAAVYGVLNNRRADDEYEQLEELCAQEASRCVQRLPGGAYADAAVEAQYQDVRTLDRRARTGLIAGQIGVAASVVLFVLDLRNDDGPDNIPYDPRTFDVMPARDGGMTLRVNVQIPRR